MKATASSPSNSLVLESALVEDVMHRGVLTCPFETPLATVARLLAANRVHCLVGLGDVTEDDTRIWGTVSDRDVVAAVAADRMHRTAGDLATAVAVTIGPHDGVRRAAQLMDEHRVSHLLVLEPGSDHPVGVVSTLDIAGVLGGLSTSPSVAPPERQAVTTPSVSTEEARRVGERLGIDWDTSPFPVEQLRAGMDVELEHGARDADTDVTGDDPIVTAKIALAHLRELPDYYTRLALMEAEGEAG